VKIAIAQMNATVGDLSGNVAKIVDFSKRARAAGADVVVTPELAVCGNPPEDLLLRDDFLARCAESVSDLAARVHGITLIVGHPRVDRAKRYNSADMAGGFGVLKDIDKMLAYSLARYRNGISPVIPQRVLDRPPSAQLKDGQTDQDSLPPYPILDAYIESDMDPADIVARGHSRGDVERVVGMVRVSEYKRRQAPIGVRITGRAFGQDWRYPITNRFRHRF
jgi:hypothetical protein